MSDTEAPTRPLSAVWLESMAYQIERGLTVHPCPKALRRVAKELEDLHDRRGDNIQDREG